MTPHEMGTKILEVTRSVPFPDGYRLISFEGDSKASSLLDGDCNAFTEIVVKFRIRLDIPSELYRSVKVGPTVMFPDDPDKPTIVE